MRTGACVGHHVGTTCTYVRVRPRTRPSRAPRNRVRSDLRFFVAGPGFPADFVVRFNIRTRYTRVFIGQVRRPFRGYSRISVSSIYLFILRSFRPGTCQINPLPGRLGMPRVRSDNPHTNPYASVSMWTNIEFGRFRAF